MFYKFILSFSVKTQAPKDHNTKNSYQIKKPSPLLSELLVNNGCHRPAPNKILALQHAALMDDKCQTPICPQAPKKLIVLPTALPVVKLPTALPTVLPPIKKTVILPKNELKHSNIPPFFLEPKNLSNNNQSASTHSESLSVKSKEENLSLSSILKTSETSQNSKTNKLKVTFI